MMKPLKSLTVVLFYSVLSFPACINDHSKEPDAEKIANEANREKIETRDFEEDAQALVKLASQDAYLSAAGKYGGAHAQEQKLKEFAGMIASHHSVASEEVKQFAAKRNYNVPDGMSNDYAARTEKMKEWKQGNDYDLKLVNELIDEHEKAVKLLEERAKNTSDTEFRAWCEKTLPTLRNHLDESRRMKEELQAGING